ncbi:MAG TPA: GyrI-like domain-containing protein [Nakamurella sp.]|nr:GyrI-like domain-containing protein [Nakamurella sp.]
MSSTISIVVVPSGPTAVIPAATTWGEFPRLWKTLLDQVHAGTRWEGSERKGRNVMLYLDDLPHVEIGVELDQPARFDPPIIHSQLPAGLVARTAHRGPYQLLGQSHDRLFGWVRERGLQPAGPRWEVYGHWHEDADMLETEIAYLLT